MTWLIQSILVLGLLALSGLAIAQTAPATTSLSLPPGPMKVKITVVQGMVQARTAPDQKWQKATQGMELTEGAELRTGPHSAVQFMIGNDQTVTLDRLGVIQILRADFESGKVFTDLGMKYGRTRYDIDSAAREHDAKVRSPSSVLAVRGTSFSLFDQPPFAPEAVSLRGRVMYRDAHKLASVGSKNGGKAKLTTSSNSPAQLALGNTGFLPAGQFGGYTQSEAEQNLENKYARVLQGNGILAQFDQARLKNFTAVAAFVGETLGINMSWTGPESTVNLSVMSPKSEILNAQNPQVPSGGAFNSQPPNDFGTAVQTATWSIGFPAGTYQITSTLASGPAVDVKLVVNRFDPRPGGTDNVTLAPDGSALPPNTPTAQFNLNAATPSQTIPVIANAPPGQASAQSVIATANHVSGKHR